MATMTGQNLLNSILESTGVEINTLIFNTLSAKLQQMIDNGTYSKLAASIAISGFSTAINDATDINELSDAVETNAALIAAAPEGGVNDIVFPSIGGDPPISVNIDTGTYESPVTFNAGGGIYQFMDDAAVATHVVINEFGSGDFISFVNADVSVYSFSNEGEDVTISYNYLNEGTMNVIRLAGVVSSDALVYDSASFTDAIGFAAFAFG